jgi:pyridoxal phosphate enzyme (YggS family)
MIAENLNKLRKDIAQAAIKNKRPEESVRIIAVSKGQPFEKILEAYAAGQRDFGESYAQEFLKKTEHAKSLNLDIRWHFIGGLQSNKLKIISHAQLVHSIDSLSHAEKLSSILEHPLEILLQVNWASSDKRQGFKPSELKHACKEISSMKNLVMKGLMTIVPLEPGAQATACFSSMKSLRDSLAAEGYGQLLLSMGMSNDFQEAIAHGADFVRIGSRIFGPRQK